MKPMSAMSFRSQLLFKKKENEHTVGTKTLTIAKR